MKPSIKSLYLGLFVLLVLYCSQAFGSTDPKLFPRPDALKPAINFWTRVFTEIDTHHGFIHDDRYLSVIYETIRLPDTRSRHRQQRYVDHVKKHYIRILRKLASGRRSGLSNEEKRVLDLWPKNVSNHTLRGAINRIRFQLGQSNKYKEGLIRSGAWREHIRKTLRKMGLPEEIAALPHVESSFNPKAYSRVGASGLWQFTRSTGRRFMRIDSVVDERMDPFKATVAAAQLLENNYAVTGTWPLALTAYNHGAAGMRNAARKMGTTDIDVIVNRYHSRTFKFASRNFYAAFLAAVDVQENADKYFGQVKLNPPVHDGIVKIPDYMTPQTVANALGVSVYDLKYKNPALRPSVWRGTKYIPRGYELRFDKSEVKGDAERALAMVAASHKYAKQKPDLYHRVRRGQTLSTIAARYHVRMRDIMALNNLRSSRYIRAGQLLRLPISGRATRIARASHHTPRTPPSDGQYTVRRGDTVSRIARRFGMKPGEILAYNDLGRHTVIYPGQTIRVSPKPVPVKEEPPTQKPKNTVVAEADTNTVDNAAAAVAASENTDGVDSSEEAADTDATDQEDTAQTATDDNAIQDNDLNDSTKTDNQQDDAEVAQSNASANDNADAAADNAPEATTANAASTTANDKTADDKVALLDSGKTADPTANAASKDQETADATDTNGDEPADAEATQLDANSPAGVAVIEDAQPDAADPTDYSVADNNTIEVQAAETLGHYADWLNIRTSRLRHINRMRYGRPVVIGKRIKLDFSRSSHDEFEKRRIAYHQALQEAFFEQFQITGTDNHKIRRGESVWVLAKHKYNVPIWLLRQYNPDLSLEKVRPGLIVKFPRLEQRPDPETDPDQQDSPTDSTDPTANTNQQKDDSPKKATKSADIAFTFMR